MPIFPHLFIDSFIKLQLSDLVFTKKSDKLQKKKQQNLAVNERHNQIWHKLREKRAWDTRALLVAPWWRPLGPPWGAWALGWETLP